MIEISVLILLILINGFFALSEIALVSSKSTRLEQKMINGSRGAYTAIQLLKNSEEFLSAIQVGITLIGIITGVYGGINIADDITPLIAKFEPLKNIAGEIALTVTVVVITYFSIIIGELVPKTIAISNPEKIAIQVAPVVYYFSKAFYPFVRLLSFSTLLVNKILGIKKPDEHITEQELRHLLKTASNEGIIGKDQNFIHEKVFYFADKKAKHLMTHRSEVEWIDMDLPYEKLYDQLRKCQHSKIVCCIENLDDLKGILNLKDFFIKASEETEFNVEDIVKAPLVIPENTDSQHVLVMMRRQKTHICCVVNEYGGFEGIITMHDIIENIVGNVPEEEEDWEPDYFIRKDKSILVNGDAPIETIGEIIPNFSVDFELIDYSTVAGFVLNYLKKIPATGDRFEYLGWQFEIVDMDRNKIDKILISEKKPKD
jgi:putative hemolysin